jgi:toxin-antitoxin system PIN domain toxin
MNTLNFLDANVWMALLWTRHLHSEKARLWFDKVGDEQFFFCRFTQITVLRLLTTEKVMGIDTKTMAEAWRLWDQIWADERVAFLPEPQGLEREFQSRSRLSSRSSKIWADAYLAAFALVAGLELVTFDRALKSLGDFVIVL